MSSEIGKLAVLLLLLYHNAQVPILVMDSVADSNVPQLTDGPGGPLHVCLLRRLRPSDRQKDREGRSTLATYGCRYHESISWYKIELIFDLFNVCSFSQLLPQKPSILGNTRV